MKNYKTAMKTLIAFATIMTLATPALAGDNGSGYGRGGRDDCDRGNGNNGNEYTSIIQDQDTSALLVRRGNDCDHNHDHDHDNDKAGNGNCNGQGDDTNSSVAG